VTRQSRTQIVGLLDRHGLTPRKALGQHFLADPNLVDKVVALAEVGPGDAVVEVGAGTGALTAALAVTGARVTAFEVDERLRPVLAETLAGMEVDLRLVDVMSVDLSAELTDGPWKLVANLPYNVGTPLLMDVLLHAPAVVMMVVMVQREVADRLVAGPGSGEYGVPSVIVGLTATVVDTFRVPPQVFVPVPNVDSAVVRLDRVAAPPCLHEAVALARIAFGQRRKMLRRSLGATVSSDQLRAAGIDPADRPEDLAPHRYLDLARVVAADV
jgi:16S rRNA (adenine1518-N6/adenine1519-N6)-dimethyltransferase